jgi:hypothetical protein
VSPPKAGPHQPIDGLTVIAAMYGTGMRLDQSVSTAHAMLDAMPELWTQGELAEEQSINLSVLGVATKALEGLAAVERRGKEKRGDSHQRLILFGATELLVDAAVDLNRFYLQLIESNTPDISSAAIKHEAVGLLAVKHTLPATTPPKDVIRIASSQRFEHPTHTIYHMLELFVKDRELGKQVGKQMLQHVRAHPLTQNSRRVGRTVAWQRAHELTGV